LWKLKDEDFSISECIALNTELEGAWKVAAMAGYFKEISRHVHGGNLEKSTKRTDQISGQWSYT
jgi:hypothetical protein